MAYALLGRSAYDQAMSTVTPSSVPMPPLGDTVAAVAQETWQGLGETSEVVDWSVIASELGIDPGEVIKAAVVLPRLGRIECVIDDEAGLQHAAEQLDALLVRGWIVNALLPIHSLGAAHQALRGLKINLQGWWTPDDKRLRFTSPEIP